MKEGFENINMENLREVLSLIFFGDEAEQKKKFIVPLQGNWYNPSQTQRLDNWIGYVIDSMETDVSIINRGDDGRRYYRNCQTTIHLSFMGVKAETMAQSVLFWLARLDVQSIMDKKYKGVINNKRFEVYSSLYMQEGLNSQLCWNVEFSLQHCIMVDSESPVLTKADISGNLIIGG